MYSIDINFLNDRPDYKPPEKKAITPTGPSTNQTPVFIGLGAAVAINLLVLGVWYYFNSDLQKLQEEQAKLDQSLGQLDKEVKIIEGIENETSQINNEADALAGVFNQIKPWSALLAELQYRLPSGVKITSIKQIEPPPPTPSAPKPASPTPTPAAAGASPPTSPSPAASATPTPPPAPPATAKLEITGVANSFSEVNDFLLLLQRSPFLKPVDTRLTSASLKDNQTKIELGEDISAAVQGLNLKLPQVVEYKIESTLSDATAAELLPELKVHQSTGLVNRIESLKQQGIIKE